MIKADVDEPLDATMAIFLSGLNWDIQVQMDLQEYGSVEKMLHKAIMIEQQNKRKSYSKPTYTPKPNYLDKVKSPTTTNNDFNTNVPAHVDKGKVVERHSVL